MLSAKNRSEAARPWWKHRAVSHDLVQRYRGHRRGIVGVVYGWGSPSAVIHNNNAAERLMHDTPLPHGIVIGSFPVSRGETFYKGNHE
jgi:hypothetical protein